MMSHWGFRHTPRADGWSLSRMDLKPSDRLTGLCQITSSAAIVIRVKHRPVGIDSHSLSIAAQKGGLATHYVEVSVTKLASGMSQKIGCLSKDNESSVSQLGSDRLSKFLTFSSG